MIQKRLVLGLASLLCVGMAQADEAAVRAGLAKILPDLKPEVVSPAPVPGMFEVQMGGHLLYATGDGRYLFQGQILDMEKKENITENREEELRRAALAKISGDSMVIFAPESYKYTVTVFTDIDCGYCRKLHKEIDDFMKAGIRVRYMLFPRSGLGSPSYDKAVSVWCADDRKQALTDAKGGKDPVKKTCDNPIKEHMALAKQFGVTGTPSILLDNGRMMPGYLPAKQLLAQLEEDAKTP